MKKIKNLSLILISIVLVILIFIVGANIKYGLFDKILHSDIYDNTSTRLDVIGLVTYVKDTGDNMYELHISIHSEDLIFMYPAKSGFDLEKYDSVTISYDMIVDTSDMKFGTINEISKN